MSLWEIGWRVRSAAFGCYERCLVPHEICETLEGTGSEAGDVWQVASRASTIIYLAPLYGGRAFEYVPLRDGSALSRPSASAEEIHSPTRFCITLVPSDHLRAFADGRIAAVQLCSACGHHHHSTRRQVPDLGVPDDASLLDA